SFQSKGHWMAKGSGHLTDEDAAYNNPSRIEPKRSHQWLADATEPELFPNKKQAVQPSISKSTPEILNAAPHWENASSFHSVPSQFMDRLFGDETNRPFDLTERNIFPVVTDDSSMRRGANDQFGKDSSMGLSISHNMEDPETCLSYGGIRKVKVNQVKDSDNDLHAPKEHNTGTTVGHLYNHGNETSFISMGQGYSNEDENLMFMGHTYNKDNAGIRSIGSVSEKGNDNSISIGHSYTKGEANTISFGGFQEEPLFDPLARPLSSYQLIYDQSSIQTSDTKEFDASTASPVVNVSHVAKSRPESSSKNKSELKSSKKEAPNSFPSNVRSLISTGILDGVPVKYISLSREELRGVIKGAGYLCGCQACNYSKALNAYEFERHAGCKTKHPNNHIYFDSGKTIYQIVQDLKNAPESQLFDAIQTVTGSPINQKAFRIWKESYQAASRELQRIYGKEELNL
ncbi:Mental retardation GTPase activating protein, partial [Actinidia chinensis var. chinensis]